LRGLEKEIKYHNIKKQIKDGVVADASVVALLETMVKNDESMQANLDIMDVCNKKDGCEINRLFCIAKS